jgi:hypothetical protein
MIAFGITLLLVALAAFILCLIEPLRDIAAATVQLLDGVEQHRRAQATGVFKHAGLLDMDED